MEEENEKIISGGMLLTLLFLFAVWGQLMLYFHGVDYRESLSSDAKMDCARYHAERILQAPRPVPDLLTMYDSFTPFHLSFDSFLLPVITMMNVERILGDHYLFWEHRYSRAILHYRKALKYRNKGNSIIYLPFRWFIQSRLAYGYLKKGEKEHCKKILEDIYNEFEKNKYTLSKDEDDRKSVSDMVLLDYYTSLAYYLMEDGKYTEAQNAVEKVIKLSDNLSVENNIRFVGAVFYKKMGDHIRLEKELVRLERHCLKIQEFIPYIYFELLELYEKQRNWDKCIALIKRNFPFFEVNGRVDFSLLGKDLIRIFDKMGEKEKAARLRKILTPLTPEFSSYIEKKRKVIF